MDSNSTKRVHRYVTNDFTVRAAVVNATHVVKEMQTLQNTLPFPTIAVGRAMVGAVLMASQLKNGQQVGVYVKGNGGLGAIYAEAHFEGGVRGYTPFPTFQPPNYDDGFSLKKSIGNGTLSVARHLPFQKQPHQGTVSLVSGEIGEDIGHYLVQSHQIRNMVLLGVQLDNVGGVRSAGGIIVEVMPGVEDRVVDILEKNYQAMQAKILKDLHAGASEGELIAPLLQGLPFTELDHNYPVTYYCPCNKDRVVRALETLGEAELEDMITKNEKADITCQMCGRPYEVSVEELGEIKDKLHKNSLH
ncbi:MAG: Hsp33 family molecular chaperone HslO [Bdellovibrionota bacterium]